LADLLLAHLHIV